MPLRSGEEKFIRNREKVVGAQAEEDVSLSRIHVYLRVQSRRSGSFKPCGLFLSNTLENQIASISKTRTLKETRCTKPCIDTLISLSYCSVFSVMDVRQRHSFHRNLKKGTENKRSLLCFGSSHSQIETLTSS